MSGEEVGGESVKGRPGLSGFILKILACLTMTADHIGAILFPGVLVLRAIGRVSFPLFAFLSAEGSRYSHRPVIRFLTIAALGLVCEIVYDVFSGHWYGNILLSLAASAGLNILMKEAKTAAAGGNRSRAIVWAAAFAVAVVGVYFFCRYVGVDYGFAGVMTPVALCLFDFRGLEVPRALAALDCFAVRLLIFAGCLVWLTFSSAVPGLQAWCLCALVPVLLYSGRPGKYKLKYAFYAYYPLHLLVIELISVIIS